MTSWVNSVASAFATIFGAVATPANVAAALNAVGNAAVPADVTRAKALFTGLQNAFGDPDVIKAECMQIRQLQNVPRVIGDIARALPTVMDINTFESEISSALSVLNNSGAAVAASLQAITPQHIMSATTGN